MAPERRWTKSMRQAWEFALSTIERGLSGAAGLREYREGGGRIRTQSWYELVRLARRAYEMPEVLPRLPPEIPLPASAFTEVDYDYHRKYLVVAEWKGIHPETGEVVSGLVGVESDILLTLEEWESALEERAFEAEYAAPEAPFELGRMWFYRRAR